jgi:hypothetical protein
MPSVVLSKTVVLEELPKSAFGVPEIYEIYARVPQDEHPEEEEDDDNFEGEHTCEDLWESGEDM